MIININVISKEGVLDYSIWSWQCPDCYGTHQDIVFKKGKPSVDFVRCPYCGVRMRLYELGKGFKVKPAGRLEIKLAA